MACTAFFKALCLLWCKKLETPSYAKPIKLDAMPPNMKAIIVPLFCLLLTGNYGNIKSISLAKMLYAVIVGYLLFVKFHIGDNFQAIFYEFYMIRVIHTQIATFGVKVNGCKF